jgi:hypothetical protein
VVLLELRVGVMWCILILEAFNDFKTNNDVVDYGDGLVW